MCVLNIGVGNSYVVVVCDQQIAVVVERYLVVRTRTRGIDARGV